MIPHDLSSTPLTFFFLLLLFFNLFLFFCLLQCRASGIAMAHPPYNVKFINTVTHSIAKGNAYIVELTESIDNVQLYDLVNHDQRSSLNYYVHNNYFHDSCGTGGRIIGKGVGGVFDSNVAERFGGFHVYSEQQWLEGALGIRDVVIMNNYVEDARVSAPTHVDVLKNLHNVTCRNNTFVVDGVKTIRLMGC